MVDAYKIKYSNTHKVYLYTLHMKYYETHYEQYLNSL
jgi:hypothetical protein